MMTIQIDLANEQVLAPQLQNILSELTSEQKQKIATDLLYKFMTDSIDHQKEAYLQDKLDEFKIVGYGRKDSYEHKPAEYFIGKTLESIKDDYFWKETILKNYKSPKETIFESIHEEMNKKLNENVNTFIQSNTELKKIIESTENQIKENFPEIVTTVMSNMANNFMMQMFANVSMTEQHQYSIKQILDNQQRLFQNGR